MEHQSYLVTTPIYYVNAAPHLGTAYTTIAADVLVRWKRLDGADAFLLTGLDEHGQKIAQSAQAAGVTPQEWVDSMAPEYRAIWEDLDVDYDRFVRTTDESHVLGVQRFWERLRDSGYLYKGVYEGWYCVPDETFVAEDELTDEGMCPHCGRDVVAVREENWFFKLSAFTDRLLAHYEEHPDFVRPHTRRNEVVSFVKSGLNDLSVSRTTFTWGVPIPFDPGHVTYVWFDALLNYITAVGFGDPERAEEFARRWPAQVHFVGKDIIRFHCVIWPAMLMAAGLELPQSVFAHGFLLTKGEKMSKSKGNAMAPLDLVDRYGVDAYRYYFMTDVQLGADGSISLERMDQVYNADLANSWGNLCSRVLNMAGKYFDWAVPAVDRELPAYAESPLRTIAEGLYPRVSAAFDELDYSGAAEAIFELVYAANHYVEDSAPWAIAKDPERGGELAVVIYNLLESIRIVAALLAPFTPRVSNEVWRRLGLSGLDAVDDIAAVAQWGALPDGSPIEKGDALFPRIVEDENA